jgi:hypothetical protein
MYVCVYVFTYICTRVYVYVHKWILNIFKDWKCFHDTTFFIKKENHNVSVLHILSLLVILTSGSWSSTVSKGGG